MALTVQQLQSNLDAVTQAIGGPTLKVRFPDGREVTYRSTDELLKAKAAIEEDIRQDQRADREPRPVRAAPARRWSHRPNAGRPLVTK
jgi:hypothetical protein